MLKDLIGAYKQAFRLWMKRKVGPLSYQEAEEKKLFWSKCYMITGLLGLGYFLFHLTYGDLKSDSNKKIQTALGISQRLQPEGNIRVMKFSGFKKVKDYKINKDEINEAEALAPLENAVKNS